MYVYGSLYADQESHMILPKMQVFNGGAGLEVDYPLMITLFKVRKRFH